MTYLIDVLCLFAKWMRPHLLGISTALVATVFIVFGSDINRAIRRLIKDYHFLARLMIFIAVCAFGYGLVMVALATVLARIFIRMEPVALAPVIFLLFAIIGFIAERKNHM